MKNKFVIDYGNVSYLYWCFLSFNVEIFKLCKSGRKTMNYLRCVYLKKLPLHSRKGWKRNK